jgi:anti-anti-sigma regulatory factor
MSAEQIKLSPVIDLTTAQVLKNDLILPYHDGRAIDLDASEVERIGTPGLQLIWSAMASFSTSGIGLKILNPSSAFLDAFEDAGLDFSSRFQIETGIN